MSPHERDRILSRIRACLRLAGSPEPHEAAAALRQAQKWMRHYGLTREQVELSHASTAAGSSALTPRRWVAGLSQVVAGAFAVHPFYLRARCGEARVEFIGRGDAATVAVYAYAALRRQIVRDRTRKLREMRRLKRSTRIRRAELYCEGWVAAVADRVREMAQGLPSGEEIDRYLAAHGQSTEPVATRSRRVRRGDLAALIAGQSDGAQAVLHHGVSGGGSAPRLPGKLTA